MSLSVSCQGPVRSRWASHEQQNHLWVTLCGIDSLIDELLEKLDLWIELDVFETQNVPLPILVWCCQKG